MFYSIANGKCRLDFNILIFLFFIWTIKNFDIVIKDANSFGSILAVCYFTANKDTFLYRGL